MGTIASGVRFIVGAAMVAAGVALATPCGFLIAEHMAAAERGAHQVGAAMAMPGPAVVASEAMHQPQAMPLPAAPAWPPQDPPAEVPVAQSPAPPLRADYVPPPPPDRLPPVAAALQAEGPGLNGTYRSTLDVPPPPLLDAQAAPPPVAAWAAPAVARPAALPPADLVPATYVIHDGDDLTGISTRFYGHPGGAAAVWEANRDVIPDPNLLPIGTELRLPPAWTVGGPHAHASAASVRSIEPPHSPAAMPRPSAPAAPAPQVWLGSPQAMQVSGAVPTRTTALGGTVRLGPGETLESLAVRLYGDRAAADRIWQVNRDRLRSPELAVAGMELRLP